MKTSRSFCYFNRSSSSMFRTSHRQVEDSLMWLLLWKTTSGVHLSQITMLKKEFLFPFCHSKVPVLRKCRSEAHVPGDRQQNLLITVQQHAFLVTSKVAGGWSWMPVAGMIKVSGVWEQKHPQPSNPFVEVIKNDVKSSFQVVLKPLNNWWLFAMKRYDEQSQLQTFYLTKHLEKIMLKKHNEWLQTTPQTRAMQKLLHYDRTKTCIWNKTVK